MRDIITVILIIAVLVLVIQPKKTSEPIIVTKIDTIVDVKNIVKYNRNDIIPGNNLLCLKEKEILRQKLYKIFKNIDRSSPDYKFIQDILEENIFFDEIIEINEVENKYSYAYDLTVSDNL